MNPMLMAMLSNRLGPIRQMIQTMRAAQNPALALQQMAKNNPQIQQAIQLVQQSGGDGNAVFNKLCQEQGFDPQQFLSMLNGF